MVSPHVTECVLSCQREAMEEDMDSYQVTSQPPPAAAAATPPVVHSAA